MGSGSSRLGDRRPKPTNFKRRLSTFICGSSSSRATAEMEDYPVELLVNSARYSNSVAGNSQALHKDSALRSTEEIEFASSKSEQESLTDSTALSSEGWLLESAQGNIESASKGKHSIVGNESVLARRLHEESRSSQLGTSSASCSGGQSSKDVDCGMILSGVNDPDNTETLNGVLSPVRLPQQELGSMCSHRDGIGGHSDVQTELVDSSSVVSPALSSSNTGSRSLEDDSNQGALTLDLGFLMSDRIQSSTEEGNVLHIDISSVSSADFSGISNEISTREARRNSSAFSSHNSRRRADFPTLLFATDDVDNIGYRQSWLLGLGSNNLNDDGISDDLWHLGRRSHLADNRRRQSRSEFWGRLRGGIGERGGRIICSSGLHPDGSCLCGLEDESSSQNSMSRILMLAEALFEVLDELHQQPSFGLSIFSNPAPESSVDSLLVKSYEKSTAVESGDDMEQCYICLEEYETGDKIRVLPCAHEYHMKCVDKWLKEIHGVCPLCRRNVSQGTPEGSFPDSNGSSMPVDLL